MLIDDFRGFHTLAKRLNLKGYVRATYLTLLGEFNESRWADSLHYSIRDLAEVTGIPKSSTLIAVHKLKELGLIEVSIGGRARPSVFSLVGHTSGRKAVQWPVLNSGAILGHSDARAEREDKKDNKDAEEPQDLKEEDFKISSPPPTTTVNKRACAQENLALVLWTTEVGQNISDSLRAELIKLYDENPEIYKRALSVAVKANSRKVVSFNFFLKIFKNLLRREEGKNNEENSKDLKPEKNSEEDEKENKREKNLKSKTSFENTEKIKSEIKNEKIEKIEKSESEIKKDTAFNKDFSENSIENIDNSKEKLGIDNSEKVSENTENEICDSSKQILRIENTEKNENESEVENDSENKIKIEDEIETPGLAGYDGEFRNDEIEDYELEDTIDEFFKNDPYNLKPECSTNRLVLLRYLQEMRYGSKHKKHWPVEHNEFDTLIVHREDYLETNVKVIKSSNLYYENYAQAFISTFHKILKKFPERDPKSYADKWFLVCQARLDLIKNRKKWKEILNDNLGSEKENAKIQEKFNEKKSADNSGNIDSKPENSDRISGNSGRIEENISEKKFEKRLDKLNSMCYNVGKQVGTKLEGDNLSRGFQGTDRTLFDKKEIRGGVITEGKIGVGERENRNVAGHSTEVGGSGNCNSEGGISTEEKNSNNSKNDIVNEAKERILNEIRSATCDNNQYDDPEHPRGWYKHPDAFGGRLVWFEPQKYCNNWQLFKKLFDDVSEVARKLLNSRIKRIFEAVFYRAKICSGLQNRYNCNVRDFEFDYTYGCGTSDKFQWLREVRGRLSVEELQIFDTAMQENNRIIRSSIDALPSQEELDACGFNTKDCNFPGITTELFRRLFFEMWIDYGLVYFVQALPDCRYTYNRHHGSVKNIRTDDDWYLGTEATERQPQKNG